MLVQVTVLLCNVLFVSPRQTPLSRSTRQVDFLSHKILDLEKRLFIEERKTAELEKQLADIRQKSSPVNVQTTQDLPESRTSLHNTEASMVVFRADIANIRFSIGTEKLERVRLEKMVQEVKDGLEKCGHQKDLAQLRNSTQWLAEKFKDIEGKCFAVTESDARCSQPTNETTKPNDVRKTASVGPKYNGKALNDEDDRKANDCADLHDFGYRQNGIYRINLAEFSSILAHCNLKETPRNWNMGGGALSGIRGWMTVQYRDSGEENFNRTWEEYKMGFGNLSSEFWLGNKYVWQFLNTSTVRPLIFLRLYSPGYFYYHRFLISGGLTMQSEEAGYRIDFKSYSYGQETKFQGPGKGEFMTWDRQRSTPGCHPVDGGWWYGPVSECKYRKHSINSRYGPVRQHKGGELFQGYRHTYWDSRTKSDLNKIFFRSELLIHFRKN